MLMHLIRASVLGHSVSFPLLDVQHPRLKSPRTVVVTAEVF